MARPQQVTDEQITAMLRECVLEHGPQVSLDIVANRLGVSQPALLKRFGSRRAMMTAALVPSGPPPWVAQIANGPDDRPFRDQLEELFTRITAYMEGVVPCMSALRESGIPAKELLALMKPPPPVVALQNVTRWLTRAQKKGLLQTRGINLESIAAAMLGALNAQIHISHLIQQSWTNRTNREFVSDIADLFANALCVSKSPPAARRGRM